MSVFRVRLLKHQQPRNNFKLVGQGTKYTLKICVGSSGRRLEKSCLVSRLGCPGRARWAVTRTEVGGPGAVGTKSKNAPTIRVSGGWAGRRVEKVFLTRMLSVYHVSDWLCLTLWHMLGFRVVDQAAFPSTPAFRLTITRVGQVPMISSGRRVRTRPLGDHVRRV